MTERLLAYFRDVEESEYDREEFTELAVLAGERGDVAMLQTLHAAGFSVGVHTLYACFRSYSAAARAWAVEHIGDAWLLLFEKMTLWMAPCERDTWRKIIEQTWSGEDAEKLVRAAVERFHSLEAFTILEGRGMLSRHRAALDEGIRKQNKSLMYEPIMKWLQAKGYMPLC